MTSVDALLEGKRIVICAGSGGVGKTTTAAALAMGMAERGLRVAVVTIDPARRLATSLGLEELGNEPRLVDPERFAAHGVEVEGELWAMMLDAKRTFDALIERLAPDERTRDEVFANRIYQQLSSAVAGSQEFTAIAKLYELDQEGGLRPAGARHAAVAQRARLPRRPAAAEGVLRRARDPHVPAPGGAERQGARPRHRDGVLAAQARHRASTCCRTCRCSSARWAG